MKKPNELHALGTALTLFWHLGLVDCESENIIFPDEENSATKDIDCIAVFGRKRFAFEHSIIEFYPGQIDYSNISYEFMGEVNRRLGDILSKDWHYTLVIDPDLLLRKRKKDLDKLTVSIVHEFKVNLQNIRPEFEHRFLYRNLPILIYCETIPGLDNGTVYRVPTSPSVDIELKTMQRVRTLFAAKLPKLIRYRLTGHKTVLLVEDVSGRFMTKIDRELIGFWNILKTFLFVDYLVMFVSNNSRMVVVNLWKKGLSWPKYTPMERRFSVFDLEKTSNKVFNLT